MDLWALTLADMQTRRGRAWRNLQDTTFDEIMNPRLAMSWPSWQRFEDYYFEGALIWLDADTLIRERSQGKRSLDDFARAFFGVENGRMTPMTYTFGDIVQALNRIEAYDWATFLRTSLDRRGGDGPMDGLKRSGYRLVFTDTPGDFWKAIEAAKPKSDIFTNSVGFAVDADANVQRVLWDSPAFNAGIIPGMQLLAVNGLVFEAGKLRSAIKDAKSLSAPIELLVKQDERIRTVKVDNRLVAIPTFGAR